MNGEGPTSLNNTPETGSSRNNSLRGGDLQTTRKLQLLSVGTLVLGVFEDEIATIAEWRRPTPLPQPPPAVLGVVSIQGRMLTVLDPVSLFGETTTRLGFPPGLLVALRGDEQIALAVESRGDTLDLAMQDIQPSDLANSALGGTIQYREGLVNSNSS